MTVMPLQRPGQSKQTYQTDRAFIEAVVLRFGAITFDLAAEPETAQAEGFFTKEDDAFTYDWADPALGNHLWLNPPFSHIGMWAKRCMTSMRRIRREQPERRADLSFLVPASIGSDWFAEFVWDSARVLALTGRLQFVDADDPYPKDCILARFGTHVFPGFELWDWRKSLHPSI
jgi:phage N-6-adenine-methyltransferase